MDVPPVGSEQAIEVQVGGMERAGGVECPVGPADLRMLVQVAHKAGEPEALAVRLVRILDARMVIVAGAKLADEHRRLHNLRGIEQVAP